VLLEEAALLELAVLEEALLELAALDEAALLEEAALEEEALLELAALLDEALLLEAVLDVLLVVVLPQAASASTSAAITQMTPTVLRSLLSFMIDCLQKIFLVRPFSRTKPSIPHKSEQGFMAA